MYSLAYIVDMPLNSHSSDEPYNCEDPRTWDASVQFHDILNAEPCASSAEDIKPYDATSLEVQYVRNTISPLIREINQQ